MKPLVIYHADCADGFGAAFAAWLKLGDDAEYVPMQYDQVKNVADLNSILSSAGIPFGEGEVYVLDFSFPKDVMKWLFKEVKRVVWLDHHKTAFEMWCGEYRRGIRYSKNHEPHWVLLDDNKSGALLAWEYFQPDTEVPMFIKHIDDYDRWQFKIEGTKAFQKALWSYTPWSFAQWQGISKAFTRDEEYREGVYSEGEAILRSHAQNVKSVVDNCARECAIALPSEAVFIVEGTLQPRGLAANCPAHMVSDVGHTLAEMSGTYGLCWSIDKDGICRCGLRSIGDYDVSAIAKALGGGGHLNSAGFSVDINTLLGWLK